MCYGLISPHRSIFLLIYLFIFFIFLFPTEKKPPSVCITQSKEKKQALIMRYVPPIGNDDESSNNNGIYISPDCLSIEKIFATAVRSYSISMLKNLLGQLSVDAFFKENAALNLDLPSLEFKPFECCLKKESISASIDSRTGFLLLNVGIKNQSKSEPESPCFYFPLKIDYWNAQLERGYNRTWFLSFVFLLDNRCYTCILVQLSGHAFSGFNFLIVHLNRVKSFKLSRKL